MLLFYGDITQDDLARLQKLYVAAFNYMYDVAAEDIEVDLKAYPCYTQEGWGCFSFFDLLLLCKFLADACIEMVLLLYLCC